MAEVSQNAPLNASTEKLSIVDKYFSLKKEGRINRMQFFVRNIMGIVMWFCIMFCIGIIVMISPFFLDRGSMGLFSVILVPIFTVTTIVPLYVFCINTCKRAHDLNHNGLWYCLGCIGGPIIAYFPILIITFCLSFILTDFILSAVFGNFPQFMLIIGKISVFMPLLIIISVLQFRKGNPGNNQYGPAPTGKPLV